MTTKELEKFKSWLHNNGAEILPPTNQYELIRFKGTEVGVIYTSGKYSGIFANRTYTEFRNNKTWSGRPISTGRDKSYVRYKKQLLKRDGDRCFYCGEYLRDDITVEHIQSLVSGGKNTLGNMVLAHEKCNQEAGNLTVSDKVKLAINKRINTGIKPDK